MQWSDNNNGYYFEVFQKFLIGYLNQIIYLFERR